MPINNALAQAVARLRQATPGAASAAGGGDFLASLQSALASVSRAQSVASELQRQFQLENPHVSLEETMIAMNKAQIAFAAALQVRNRLVQAYEQIMNMPV
ncbi:MAG: flagellar hook-basal body complex protein FliE [Sutterellaceae bacterium]|nr:flagellar hook-basal body complex protein FliE [Burkholderiaceae bacterium]MCX7900685.1 flagellar hook-basal body complex protein FliE [Burkholderiaceae bacterium]MDW8431018.1 flagellar hook-basal body complex protein FliE [Sutterellaceae bacterium]